MAHVWRMYLHPMLVSMYVCAYFYMDIDYSDVIKSR